MNDLALSAVRSLLRRCSDATSRAADGLSDQEWEFHDLCYVRSQLKTAVALSREALKRCDRKYRENQKRPLPMADA